VIDTVDLDLVTRVLAEQNPIALLDPDGPNLALVVDLAVADRDDLALGGLFLGGIGDDGSVTCLALTVGDCQRGNLSANPLESMVCTAALALRAGRLPGFAHVSIRNH